MRPEEQIITKQEYLDYKNGKYVYSLDRIWKNILNQLPKKQRDEATQKGYELSEFSNNLGILNLKISVPNSSKDFDREFMSIYPFIMCYWD